MSTWRYIARFKGTNSERTRPYNFFLESEKQGIDGLEKFLEGRIQEFSDRLRWVGLEKSESEAEYNDPHATWEEIKRLTP